MKIKLRGKTFDFVRKNKIILDKKADYDGFCEHPQSYKKRIVIDKNLEGKEELETILHECLHGAFWDLSEEAVDEAAGDITNILWRLGYRKED